MRDQTVLEWLSTKRHGRHQKRNRLIVDKSISYEGVEGNAANDSTLAVLLLFDFSLAKFWIISPTHTHLYIVMPTLWEAVIHSKRIRLINVNQIISADDRPSCLFDKPRYQLTRLVPGMLVKTSSCRCQSYCEYQRMRSHSYWSTGYLLSGWKSRWCGSSSFLLCYWKSAAAAVQRLSAELSTHQTAAARRVASRSRRDHRHHAATAPTTRRPTAR